MGAVFYAAFSFSVSLWITTPSSIQPSLFSRHFFLVSTKWKGTHNVIRWFWHEPLPTVLRSWVASLAKCWPSGSSRFWADLCGHREQAKRGEPRVFCRWLSTLIDEESWLWINLPFSRLHLQFFAYIWHCLQCGHFVGDNNRSITILIFHLHYQFDDLRHYLFGVVALQNWLQVQQKFVDLFN